MCCAVLCCAVLYAALLSSADSLFSPPHPTPDILDKEEAGKTTFIINDEGIMDSLATVLSHEMVKFNKLLLRCASSLTNMKKAIKGLVVMSKDLDRMYTNILNNRVPAIWTTVSYSSLKPLASWVEDLQFRINFMRRWLRSGKPSAFPLPLFFFPQGFLTGALQNHARKFAVPINALTFNFTVLEIAGVNEIEEAPENGVYVFGLHLEGAKWSSANKQIEEASVGEMYSPLPPVWFVSLSRASKGRDNPRDAQCEATLTRTPHARPWTQLPEKDYERDVSDYSCPTYQTSVRAGKLSTTGVSTNYVLSVDLKTSKPTEWWTFKGTALLCNLDN